MRNKKVEVELYYLENGNVVFTPEYHIERGYCCGNGCRHCPYEPKHQRGNKKLEPVWEKTNRQNTEN